MSEILVVQKKKTPRRVRYWIYTFFIIGLLGIITLFYVSNYNKTFVPLVYADALASNGVTQQIAVDKEGYAAIRQGVEGEYDLCEYQMKDVEIVAIQQALVNVDDSFIAEEDAPELEAGMYRVFYKGKAVIVFKGSLESEQILVNSLYGPLRENCVTNN